MCPIIYRQLLLYYLSYLKYVSICVNCKCLVEVRDMKTEETGTLFSAIKCTVIDCRNRCIIGVCVFPWNWQTPIIICILVVKHLSTSDPQIKCHFFDVLHYQFAELPLEHLEKDNAVARPTEACQKEFHHLFWRNLYSILFIHVIFLWFSWKKLLPS